MVELNGLTAKACHGSSIVSANEVMGGAVWKAHRLVKKPPRRNMPLPRGDVSRHRVPNDPWSLIATVGDCFVRWLVPGARVVNDHVPLHVLDLKVEAMQEAGEEVAG